MKHTIFSLFCLIFLFSPCQFTEALEFELNGGLNLLTYHPDRETAHSVSENFMKFQTYPFVIGNVSVRGDITNTLAISINAVRDNVLLNSVNILLSNRTDYFRFEFGPFAGMDDKPEIPDVGIKGSIEFTFPGIAFFSFGGSSTLGSSFDFSSNNFRESAEARFGFWMSNLIPSISASTKSFTRQANEFMTLRDTLTRFQFSVDMFSKDTSATFRIDAGYETYTRVYTGGSEENVDELSAWFAGFEFRFQVSKPLRIITGLEMPIIYTAVGPMIAPDFPWNMFKANAGFIYTFF